MRSKIIVNQSCDSCGFANTNQKKTKMSILNNQPNKTTDKNKSLKTG